MPHLHSHKNGEQFQLGDMETLLHDTCWKFGVEKFPKQTAPQPVRHASVAKRWGLETTMLDGITETLLKCCRKNFHHCRSDRTSAGILIRALQFCGAPFRVLMSWHLKAHPGRTHEVTNDNLPRSRCKSLRVQNWTLDQELSSSCSSWRLNWGTVKIMLAVLICTPRQVISQQGGMSLSGEACKLSSEKILFMHAKSVCDVSGVEVP